MHLIRSTLPRTILVVDDEKMTTTTLAALLMMVLKYEVKVFNDPVQAPEEDSHE